MEENGNNKDNDNRDNSDNSDDAEDNIIDNYNSSNMKVT